jgi:hypothetical protein
MRTSPWGEGWSAEAFVYCTIDLGAAAGVSTVCVLGGGGMCATLSGGALQSAVRALCSLLYVRLHHNS